MSAVLKEYEMTMSERVVARTVVEATSAEAAEALAARRWHADCESALDAHEGLTEVLEFNGPDWVEVEELSS